jgi:hypothetical protein
LSRKASRPKLGRSSGCSQPALAEAGAIRLIARSVNDAPTIALTSRNIGVVRMDRWSPGSFESQGTLQDGWIAPSNIQRAVGDRKVVVPNFKGVLSEGVPPGRDRTADRARHRGLARLPDPSRTLWRFGT